MPACMRAWVCMGVWPGIVLAEKNCTGSWSPHALVPTPGSWGHAGPAFPSVGQDAGAPTYWPLYKYKETKDFQRKKVKLKVKSISVYNCFTHNSTCDHGSYPVVLIWVLICPPKSSRLYCFPSKDRELPSICNPGGGIPLSLARFCRIWEGFSWSRHWLVPEL